MLNKFKIVAKKSKTKYFQMPMVAMGTSMVAGLIAAASLAYALTLESRLLTLQSDKSSICTTVSTFT